MGPTLSGIGTAHEDVFESPGIGLALGQAELPVTPQDVWGAWNLDPVVLSVVFLALWAHRRGRTGATGRPMDRWRGAAFGVALAALVVALVSPLDALAGALASAHMVQHVLVLLIAAPLLAWSAPSSIVLRGAPLSLRRITVRWRRGLRPGTRRVLALGGPVAVWLLHVLVVWTWHSAVAYEAALANGWVHIAEHATFLATGVLFWRVVVGPRAGASRVPPGLGVLLVFGMAMQGVFLSALLTFANEPFYPSYGGSTAAWGLDPLADQHLAGVLMWFPGAVVYLGVALVLLVTWLQGLEDGQVAPAHAEAAQSDEVIRQTTSSRPARGGA